MTPIENLDKWKSLYVLAMTEPESTSSEMEERSANVSDADVNAVRREKD